MSEPDAAPRQEAAVTSDAIESPLLEVDGLRKEFGGVVAVDGATFSVAEGSLTGLIGPNGAGKSTTFNCITGIHEPTGGRVTFDGQNITGLAPYTLANRGLVRTFQIARELSDMTVIENVMLAPGGQVGESVVRSVTPGLRDDVIADETAVRDRAWETLEFFEIDHLAHENAGNLSGGQRKLLEMARVLMTDPEMILLDEPLAGVNPTLEEKLLERIHELRQEQGLTFLLVEHDMDVIMNNCEHIIVMHQGSVLAEGDAETIKSDERVLEAYLGGDV
ncbi:ABC transporter ATP-binding protein [Haloarcula rubripromontorii]|uniref:Probable branched-chain amino acid transport ATP-binding protein LivG n=1 Tax=Haloarcula rubripromontorii TaxID=1705562 RepID=A0A0N0BNZ0_9EURY|nr:ABC transporter ATP-binding protein [Haloarcula rubripromontorii]KOX92996.1 branched-chain amino acid ABC transporter ATPase [Haloarcula rubripromontorii]